MDSEAALKPGAPQIHEDGNLTGEPKSTSAATSRPGFRQADVVVEQTYVTQAALHNCLEPHGCTAAWEGDHLTIWDSTQSIFDVRQTGRRALELPEHHVRVIKQFMGGGFGSKQIAWKHTAIAALLSKQAGRPVQLMLDREAENLAAGNRNPTRQRVRLGARPTARSSRSRRGSSSGRRLQGRRRERQRRGHEREVGPAGPDEVVVRVDATPINPSDLNQLLGPADLATLERSGTPERPVVTATVPPHLVGMIASRVDQSLTLGVEGAGLVVEAGTNAQHLVGAVVSAAPGQMYTQYRKLQASEVFPFPDGVTAQQGASAFVNPLTALGMLYHAAGGTLGAGSHGGGLESGPDAQQDLHGRRCRSRQRRAEFRAGGDPRLDRCEAHRQLLRQRLPPAVDERDQRHRGHACL